MGGWNVPNYERQRFSLGPGVVYLGIAGLTPTVDVGGQRSGMVIEPVSENVDIDQGNPAMTVETFSRLQSVIARFTDLEWNPGRMAQALGAGLSEGAGNIMSFGGRVLTTKMAIKFVHDLPYGAKIEARIWNARGEGTHPLNFTDDPHEFEMSFKAIVAHTDWAGAALPKEKQLMRLIYTPGS